MRQPQTVADHLAAGNTMLPDRPKRATGPLRQQPRKLGIRAPIPLLVVLLVLLLVLAAVVAGSRAVDEDRYGAVVDDTTFEQIATGRRHVLALDDHGRIWSWGSNDHGQLGNGAGTFVAAGDGTVFVSGADVRRPEQLDLQGTFVAVAAGDHTSVAVDDRGRLWRWGSISDDGPCDEICGSDDVVATPVVLDLVGAVIGPMEVDAGSIIGTRLFVRSAADGSVYLVNARTGSIEPIDAMSSDLVDSWAAIAVGDHHTVAIGFDGFLYSWGSNESGALCLGHSEDQPFPTLVTRQGTAEPNARRVAAGNRTTAIIDADGTLSTCGENGDGQLATGGSTDQSLLTAVATGVRFAEVSMSDGFSVAIDVTGQLWSWGSDRSGQLGNGPDGDQLVPRRITGRVGERRRR